MIILGIESSCDESAAAICKDGEILSNQIATQNVHEQYGGVVPELASRAHQQNIVPVVSNALQQSDIELSSIDAIAYTQGPGLLGALLVGSSFSKSLALSLGVPLVPVNHMQGHVLSHFIEAPFPEFPFLCLTVSGGHTQIVKVDSYLSMEIIGTTIDDAVGEAFDKCAKLLGLGYPGGPKIDQNAKKGNPMAFKFTKSNIPNYDFSFSGIKTSFLYFLRDQTKTDKYFIEENINDLCASLQKNLIDMLLEKLIKASAELKINQVAIAGGVSANLGLRSTIKGEADAKGWDVFIPKFEYCTDNAAMIAITGYHMFQSQKFGTLRDSPKPRLSF